MAKDSVQLKKYKVLKRLGWNKGIYAEGDTVEMEPRFAEYYINEKVLENSSDLAPVAPPAPAEIQSSPTTSTTPTTETEAS